MKEDVTSVEETATSFEFLGQPVKMTKPDSYRVPVEAYRKFMDSEHGIKKETLEKINEAHADLYGQMSKFACDRVVENGGKAKLVVPTGGNMEMSAGVNEHMLVHAKLDENGNPSEVFGVITLGAKVKVKNASMKDEIAAACKAAYMKRNK